MKNTAIIIIHKIIEFPIFLTRKII